MAGHVECYATVYTTGFCNLFKVYVRLTATQHGGKACLCPICRHISLSAAAEVPSMEYGMEFRFSSVRYISTTHRLLHGEGDPVSGCEGH